jgi:hypothetical protein
VLKLKFTETNSGGRIYTSEFTIHFENIGFTSSAATNSSSEFNIRLKDWMTKFQDALVKASGYDKPFDAFKDVPTFTDAVNASYVTPVAPSSTTQKQNSASSPPTNTQERLQTLKDLLDKKLITQDDFDKKRREILNSL